MRISPINTSIRIDTRINKKDIVEREKNTQEYHYNPVFYGIIPPAKRLQNSEYLISGYIREIGKARNFHGDRAIVDLSMGNPDLTPPEKAKQMLKAKVNDLWSHRYNSPKGEGALFHTVSNWMKKRFNVDVNPRTEVMVTSGSSDAVDHIFTAFANNGDKVLVPNPGYSLYDDLITRHDLKKIAFDLNPDNGYLPDFSTMPGDAKILILNYPHNPTGSFAPKNVFEKAVMARIVSFCLETGNHIIKGATDKPENIELYKKLGMIECGTRNFNGVTNTVFKFDKEAMELFLNKYQINLSF